MSELKPCPICGSTVVIQKIEPRLYRPTRNHPYSVVCYNCDLIFGYDIDYGGIFDTEEEAAEAWNRRSGEQEQKKGEWIAVDSFSAYGGDEATWMAHGNPIAFYYCSECKEQAYAGEDGESLITEYCPNCGADMRGEQDG